MFDRLGSRDFRRSGHAVGGSTILTRTLAAVTTVAVATATFAWCTCSLGFTLGFIRSRGLRVGLQGSD